MSSVGYVLGLKNGRDSRHVQDAKWRHRINTSIYTKSFQTPQVECFRKTASLAHQELALGKAGSFMKSFGNHTEKLKLLGGNMH